MNSRQNLTGKICWGQRRCALTRLAACSSCPSRCERLLASRPCHGPANYTAQACLLLPSAEDSMCLLKSPHICPEEKDCQPVGSFIQALTRNSSLPGPMQHLCGTFSPSKWRLICAYVHHIAPKMRCTTKDVAPIPFWLRSWHRSDSARRHIIWRLLYQKTHRRFCPYRDATSEADRWCRWLGKRMLLED